MTTSSISRSSRRSSPSVNPAKVHEFVDSVLGDDVHANRVSSVSDAVVGIVHAAALSIHCIGRGLATAAGLNPKHAIKQVDRLLSNAGITIWQWYAYWVPFVLGARQEAVLALDWTEFDGDDQATIAAYLVTSHGRATPLAWMTVLKSTLRNRRSRYERQLIERLEEVIPSGVRITLLADRGFGDQKLYGYLDLIGWSFAIRFRQSIAVTDRDGVSRPAVDFIPANGRAKMLRDVEVTNRRTPVAAVVVKHERRMKEAWCIATNQPDLGAAGIVRLYARRFTIEETFRDIKNIHFGMGLSATSIADPQRRDRLLFLAAIAQALLTLLGAAGEATGLDRMLKANTVKSRTMSLFNQGCYWYGAIPNMPEDRLRVLMRKFGELVATHAAFSQIFGVI